MAKGNKTKRLSKILKEFNLGIETIVDFLSDKGVEIENNPNTKIEHEVYEMLAGEFQSDKTAKEKSRELSKKKVVRETITIADTQKKEEVEPDFEPEALVFKNVEPTASLKIEPEPVSEPTPVPTAPKEEEVVVEKEEAPKEPEVPKQKIKSVDDKEITVLGKIDLPVEKERKGKKGKKEAKKVEKVVEEKPKAEAPKKVEPPKIQAPKVADHIATVTEKLTGPKVMGKIELPKPKPKPVKKKPVASSDGADSKKKRKRLPSKAVNKADFSRGKVKKGGKKKTEKVELDEKQIQKQIQETLARLSGGGSKNKGAKYRKAKREAISQQQDEADKQAEQDKGILKVTEFVTVSEMATMMDTPVNDIIGACMSLGLFVSINQRLDAETITIVAEEFGFETEFVSAEVQEAIEVEADKEEDLIDRAPIVTVMGHVDHGKTSLLDKIRDANVIAGEAGGITQHIGAYNVTLDSGKSITFLDTPGHEAFTAMRARGAQVTDIAIIIVAADDDVMPQTKEAINHAQAANVPMIIAINKIDKEGANPEKIKEQLAQMNILVEDWGGKYQCQEISAKKGLNITELLEKVLLEAELLELKANPNKNAIGTVIESELDKGRGYVSTLLVESGTMKVGDIILAGSFTGKVKAMHDERGISIKEAGPSVPVSILGIPGAPSAGERFNILNDEKEAKTIATRRETLQREQGVRTQKLITLDEIGRRLALGEFKELNLIVKGDVDGSIEALSDSLLKLSTEKVQVNIIHKAVGQISESDVVLATASNAIIIGFQVRASAGARKIAEKSQVDIRFYSIIYDVVDEIKNAMEGMLDAKIEEKITCNIEVRETFKISKVGTIAGCFVLDGKVNRNTKIRLIRDGIVAYTGLLGSLKRFKDDVKEVGKGYECGLNIEKFNDIKVGDIIEGYEEVEVAQTLNSK